MPELLQQLLGHPFGKHGEATAQPVDLRFLLLAQAAHFGPAAKQFQGVHQHGRDRQTIDMDLAQRIVTDAAYIANLAQGPVIKPVSLVPQPAQQCFPRPLQGPLVAVPPGTALVMFEQRLIGRMVCRMLDPPGIERRVEHLLIEAPVDLHIDLSVDQILAQPIGPDVWL